MIRQTDTQGKRLLLFRDFFLLLLFLCSVQEVELIKHFTFFDFTELCRKENFKCIKFWIYIDFTCFDYIRNTRIFERANQIIFKCCSLDLFFEIDNLGYPFGCTSIFEKLFLIYGWARWVHWTQVLLFCKKMH